MLPTATSNRLFKELGHIGRESLCGALVGIAAKYAASDSHSNESFAFGALTGATYNVVLQNYMDDAAFIALTAGLCAAAPYTYSKTTIIFHMYIGSIVACGRLGAALVDKKIQSFISRHTGVFAGLLSAGVTVAINNKDGSSEIPPVEEIVGSFDTLTVMGSLFMAAIAGMSFSYLGNTFKPT